VCPLVFSSYRGYGKVISRGHSCASTRPYRTDPEVLASWSLRPWHSDVLSRHTRSENINLSRALFSCYNTQNCRVYFIYLFANPSRQEWNVEYIIWRLPLMMKSSFYSSIVVDNFQSSGARSALPMGLAPKAIVELYLFEYRLKVSSGFFIIFVLLLLLPGARRAPSMGVAHETMMGCLQPIIGSKFNFLWLNHNLYFSSFSKSWCHCWRVGRTPVFHTWHNFRRVQCASSWPMCMTVCRLWFDRTLTDAHG
jgi:hypothetical protein